MSKRKKPKNKGRAPGGTPPAAWGHGLKGEYERAASLAGRGDLDGARRLLESVRSGAGDPALRALAINDLAALAALAGDAEAARRGFEEALTADPACAAARENLSALADPPPADPRPRPPAPPMSPAPMTAPALVPAAMRRTRVAIVSLLFNWPTTGGGNVHTAELALFLSRAGYEVRHFHARYDPWGVGNVSGTPFPTEALAFTEAEWSADSIKARFREAVSRFAPDHVLITDSWNMKPLLAEAMRGMRFSLRLQAMECLCPLNNVRLLPGPDGTAGQCPKHQLASPDDCARCVSERGHLSGPLHRDERALAGVGTPAYREALAWAFREADAVLALNPLVGALAGPHASRTLVVPVGMDPARFPWPPPPRPENGRKAVLFAGLVDEWMKGYRFLERACARLWASRKDFELVATGDPPGRVNGYTRFVGWLGQDRLPAQMHATDVLAVPTVAQEGLSRTAIEAMAAGVPVVASDIGGLPATIQDGVTGLLCAPGDEADLARKIAALLDDDALRRRMGAAGRRRFEELFRWDALVERHYLPLLGPPERPADAPEAQAPAPPEEHRRIFEAHPWPRVRPNAPPPSHPGWLEDGAREMLARTLSGRTRLVVELGAWVGLSTRHIADLAPNATVITIDHWRGGPEHQRRPEWRRMLPSLRDTFLDLCWDYRHRVLPLSMSTREGLKAVQSFSLSPDLIYIDADHSYAGVTSDLLLCRSLFPQAELVGDDYEAEVKEAVDDFALLVGMAVEDAGSRWRAWRLAPRK